MLSANASSASVTRPCCALEARRQLRRRERAALRQPIAVAEDAAPANGDELAVGDALEEVGTGRVDQVDAGPHELEGPGVRETPAERRCDVDDDAYARLGELLGGDTVEVGVVDDRDVVRTRGA